MATKKKVQCDPTNHNFMPLGIQGYYKDDTKGHRDPSKIYQTFYCTKCSTTVEIMIIDRNKK